MNDIRETEIWNSTRALLLAVRQLAVHDETGDSLRAFDQTCIGLLVALRRLDEAGRPGAEDRQICATLAERLTNLLDQASEQHVLRGPDAGIILGLAASIRALLGSKEEERKRNGGLGRRFWREDPTLSVRLECC